MRPYEYVTSAEKLAAIAREVEQASAVALDLETAQPGGGGSVDPLTGRIRLISLNTEKGRYVVDLYQTDTMGPLVEALNRTKAVIVGQNLKFDQKWLLWKHGVEFQRVFDTFRASHILYAGLPGLKHDLWSVYKRELDEDPATDDLAASDWDGPLSKKQLDYAADDVDRLLRVREVMRRKLLKEGLGKIAALEFQALLPEAAIELNGLRLDTEMWKKRTAYDEARARALRATLLAELPNPIAQTTLDLGLNHTDFNIDSPDQVLKAFRMLGITHKVKDPETGKTSVVPLSDTKEMTLAMCADKWPILSKFIEYRGYAKNGSAFGLDYLKHIHPTTGRIHCSYHPYTDTGRYACRQPNLQQTPRTKDFRECFRVEEGRMLAICDWSNIEMRLAAEISGDKKLIKVFNDDEDAHYVTAGLMTGKEKKDITKNERQQAKPVNFGFCIAEGQRVLTRQSGLVPIERVQDWHLVWDGVEWVSHEGVLFMGEREVITHDGLTATPDHNVYTDLGFRVPFRDAASSVRHGRLATGAVGEAPVGYTAYDAQSGTTGAESAVRRGDLCGLQADSLASGGQRKGRKDDRVRLPTSPEVSRPSGRDFGGTLRRYGAALRAGFTLLVASLQRTWNPGAIHFAGAFYSLGAGDVPALGLQGAGVRPGGQQRALLAGQPATNDVLGQSAKQGVRRIARTYDLINAGPRHRFTVEGKVVSNCYGMSASKLVLYAKSSYGVNLTEGEAKKFRRAFFEGYSGIEAWHRFALDSGKRSGETRSLWGRRRIIKDPKAHNEFLNSPVQASGADGLKNSLRVVYEKLKKLNGGGLPLLAKGANAAMVHMVHDEIIVEHKDTPELAKAAQEALHSGMIEGMAPMMPRVKTVAECGGGPDWSAK